MFLIKRVFTLYCFQIQRHFYMCIILRFRLGAG